MLGLGNALTRSINFGKVGESTPFSNYPQLGSFGQAGIVSYVSVDEQTSLATVWEVLPIPIEIPEGENFFYTDTLANAYNYVYKDFEYIKDGVVYDDFTIADTQIIDGFFDYWRDNQSKFDRGFYIAINQASRVLSDSVLIGGGSVTNQDIAEFQNSEIYHTGTVFSKSNQITYYSSSNLNPSDKFHVLAARSYQTQMLFEEKLSLDPVTIQPKAVEDIENDRYEYVRSDIKFSSDSALDYQPEPLHNFSSNTSVTVEPRNHQLFFTFTVDVGFAESVQDLVLNKLPNVAKPWYNASEQIYMKCTVAHAGHSDFTFSQLENNFSNNSVAKSVENFVVPLRKVTFNDINTSAEGLRYVHFGIDGVIAKNQNNNFYYKVCWVGEVDVRTMSSKPFVFSGQLTGIPSDKFNGLTLEERFLANSDQSIGEWHYDKGFDTPIPRDRWWSVFRVRNVSLYTNARPESDTIEIPADAQSVIVPMFPEVNIAGSVIEYGTDIDKDLPLYTFKEYMLASLNTGETEDTDYIDK